MSRLGVVLVVCLVLMAGCSGLSGGDETADREPYGVEEPVNASIDEGPEELLPGLTTEGLVDSDALREAHEETIGNQSYVLEVETEHVIENDNESFQRTSETTLYVDPEAEVVHEVVHQRFEGNISVVSPHAEAEPNRTEERWYGEETVSMTEFENGSVEYTPPQEGMPRGHDRVDRASIYLLAPLQNAEGTTTAGAVESEEGTYYVVEDEENASGDVLGPNQEGFEMEIQALVREDGLVRQTTSERVHVHGEDERTLINQTVEITAIGETEVERPDWYDDAVEAYPEAFEELAEDAPDGDEGTDGNESAGDGEPSAEEDATRADDADDANDADDDGA